MKCATKSFISTLLVSLLTLSVGLGAAEQQGTKKGQKATAPPPGMPVTLTRRKDDGPYGTSAYSLRYASQDVAIHKNDVDLVFNQCGMVHIAPQGGLKNRIARVKGTEITDALNFPTQSFQSTCFEPEKDAVYIMEIDDNVTHMRVRLHISSVTETEVRLEWMPFRDVGVGTSGTLGACTGKHGCQ